MPALFLILIKINLVLAFFAIAYFFILRRLTFYVVNRFFLVFGILFSSLYPFIDLTNFFHSHQQPGSQIAMLVPAINQQVRELAPVDLMTKYWRFISMLFYAGVIAMAVRLLLQFVSLYRLHKRSSPGFIGNIPVRILEDPVNPFSFWQTIYINPSLHKEKDLQSILVHEHIHVKQWHTLDILLAELSVVFYWFNPGVWLMKKAVKENLEFITDEKVLKRGVDKKAYQYSLVDAGSLAASSTLTNSFILSDLKKRIQMMNVQRSSKIALSRYVLVLPVLLVTALLFTISKKEAIKQFVQTAAPIVYPAITSAPHDAHATVTKRAAGKPAALRIRSVAASTFADDQTPAPDVPAANNRPPADSNGLTLYNYYVVARQREVVTKDHWPQPSAIDTMENGIMMAMEPTTSGIKDAVVVVGYLIGKRTIKMPGTIDGKNVIVVRGYPATRNNNPQH